MAHKYMDDEEYKIDKRVAVEVYKWLKIAQSIILVALGFIFIFCSLSALKSNSEQDFYSALPICIGVVLSVFGLLDLLAGYFLHRNLMSEEILLGAISISFSVVLFTKASDSSQLLASVLNIFIVSMLFVYAAMCIIYGLDRIFGKKGLKKNITLAIISFIGALVLIGGGITFLVLQNKYSGKVSQFLFLIVGIVLVVIGLVSFVSLIIKIRETKKALKLEEDKKNHLEEEKKEDMNSEVKVVELNDLKKERKRDKKVFNKEKIGETQAFSIDENGNVIEDEPKKLEDSKNEDK